jgi:hypothetical protein
MEKCIKCIRQIVREGHRKIFKTKLVSTFASKMYQCHVQVYLTYTVKIHLLYRKRGHDLIDKLFSQT